MTTCNDCLEILEPAQEVKVVEREIFPFALSSRHCSFCLFLCKFFEIPIDSIRNGKVWPSVEDVGTSKYDKEGLGLHQFGQKLEHFVKFKVVGGQSPVRQILGDCVLRGPGHHFHSLGSATLPLGKSCDYGDSQSRLGICLNITGNLARRGIWSHSGPASLATRISTVVEFLDACHSYHAKCLRATNDHIILPSRFVDVGSCDGKKEPRLISSTEVSTIERYTTLSHCWGTHPNNMPLRTTRATKAAHMVSMPMNTLPKTFRDAIRVTRALNIGYIWIDSLCIVQDDLEDWEKEAAKMASIYEGSFLTIAAADSPNSNGGLFLDSITTPVHFNFTPRLPSGASLNTQSTASFRPLLRPRANKDKLHLQNAPLYRRGWAFQELMLSPRSIHFKEHQMYWKCHSGLRSEDGTLDEIEEEFKSNIFSRSGGGTIDFSTPDRSRGTWWDWVYDFTTRSLTRPEDRVAAITGIIRYFQRVTGDTPMLGLWEKSFIPDLYWSISCGAGNVVLTGPSWSWLFHPEQTISIEHYEVWSESESEKYEPRLEDFDIKWTGSPFTSKLFSSTLHINGVIRSFRITESQNHGFFEAVRSEELDSWHWAKADCTMDDGSELFIGLEIMCLFMSYATYNLDTDGLEGESILDFRRWEYFLIICSSHPPGLSASMPPLISDSDHTKPTAYQRLGVGSFEVQLVPKQKWAKYSDREYNNISWPNPPLMFDGTERVTIELV